MTKFNEPEIPDNYRFRITESTFGIELMLQKNLVWRIWTTVDTTLPEILYSSWDIPLKEKVERSMVYLWDKKLRTEAIQVERKRLVYGD